MRKLIFPINPGEDEEPPTLNACPAKVTMRDLPSPNVKVLTTYYNKETSLG